MADTLSVLNFKPDVDREVHRVLGSYGNSSAQLSWSPDAIGRLSQFVTAGKSIRGSLVLYAYRMFKSETLPSVLKVAAAMELIHAGLLIHDDIMDRDPLRRTMPSLYMQYETYGKDNGARHPDHFGDSQAINLGDLCFFLGFSLFDPHTSGISPGVAHELTYVALAQMQDVSAGELPDPLSRDQILSVYKHKTARYSFSLPIKAGAMLANAPESIIRTLDQLGEHIGLLYQLRDDEMNDSGDARITGKTSGTDATNGKQTLRRVMNTVELASLKKDAEDKAMGLIQALPLWADQKAGLTELVRFSTSRGK